MYELTNTDTLIIGSGGAGCRAALEAHDHGAEVTIVTKGVFGRSGTTAFRVADTAGYNMADGIVDPNDNPEVHFRDIMKAALGMAYEELAWTLAKEAPGTGSYLENLGVRFETDPASGQYIEVKGCFASRPRMHLLKDHGERIIRAFIPEIRKRGIFIAEKTAISKILVLDGRCVGAMGVNAQGNPIIFAAKTVVIATGGASQLFKYTLTPNDITGDGYILGLRAGADLVNMEFMQVVLGTMSPTRNQLNTFLWCARPQLLNKDKKPFMENYLPAGVTVDDCMEDKSKHFPFSTRDNSRFIEIAIQKEMTKSCGTPEESVFLDLRGVSDEIVHKLPFDSPLPKVVPIVKEFYLKRGLAFEREPIPIGCFAHAINGGLKIDLHGRTTIQGLFAAGEVAGGAHGADRLGGNMLVTCQVLGARAGRMAAQEMQHLKHCELPETEIKGEIERLKEIQNLNGHIDVTELKSQLRETMWRETIVIRTEEKLKAALNKINDLENRFKFCGIQKYQQLICALELQNLIEVGRAIILAALHRRESRGSHYREDFPQLDPSWNKKILIRKQNENISIFEE